MKYYNYLLKPKKLSIAVTFHFSEERLHYLSKITSKFHELAHEVNVCIVTNTENINNYKKINNAIDSQLNINIVTPKLLGHPYLLTWSHFEIFRRQFEEDKDITHFMYLEDDILIEPYNIYYWIKSRELLRQDGLIPSFIRFELKLNISEPYSTDITDTQDFSSLPKVKISDSYYFINMKQPYQGMYLLDRELAAEHFFGESASPEFGIWGIREKAAQGLTFSSVPNGFSSRNLVGYMADEKRIDPKSLIHHTPNNYVDNHNSKFGKVLIENLILF